MSEAEILFGETGLAKNGKMFGMQGVVRKTPPSDLQCLQIEWQSLLQSQVPESRLS